jgi:dTMP kinase
MTGQGIFVSVDGPGGSGKSTIAELVATQLRAHRLAVYITAEPSATPLGAMIRASTDVYSGMALACLVAGDRHHHLATEIRPQRDGGAVVISDRYVPSSLVLQRIDGVSWDTICQLNAGTDRPDLAVILTADPAVLTARMAGRGGTHSRFERLPGAAQTESRLYDDTVARLSSEGWPVCQIDTTTRTPDDVAAIVTDRILSLTADRSTHGNHRPVPADIQHR